MEAELVSTHNKWFQYRKIIALHQLRESLGNVLGEEVNTLSRRPLSKSEIYNFCCMWFQKELPLPESNLEGFLSVINEEQNIFGNCFDIEALRQRLVGSTPKSSPSKGNPTNQNKENDKMKVVTETQAQENESKVYSNPKNSPSKVDPTNKSKKTVAKKVVKEKQVEEKENKVYKVGEKVLANYNNEGDFYCGIINGVKLDGDNITYNIDYDDGDYEENVLPVCVRPFGVDNDNKVDDSSIEQDSRSLEPQNEEIIAGRATDLLNIESRPSTAKINSLMDRKSSIQVSSLSPSSLKNQAKSIQSPLSLESDKELDESDLYNDDFED